MFLARISSSCFRRIVTFSPLPSNQVVKLCRGSEFVPGREKQPHASTLQNSETSLHRDNQDRLFLSSLLSALA